MGIDETIIHREAGNRCVLYVAYGNVCREEAQRSIRSLRERGKYHGPIIVISDEQFDCNDGLVNTINVDVQYAESNPYASRAAKTCIDKYSSYEKNLFLDTDTIVEKPLDSVWKYLDEGDLWMALDEATNVRDATDRWTNVPSINQRELELTRATVELGSPFFNSGVILWRKTPATAKLFADWNSKWLEFGKRDQMALARAIASAGGNAVGILPITFNFNCGHHSENAFSAVIHHHYDSSRGDRLQFWSFLFRSYLKKIRSRIVVGVIDRLMNSESLRSIFQRLIGRLLIFCKNDRIFKLYAKFHNSHLRTHELALIATYIRGFNRGCNLLVFGNGDIYKFCSNLNSGGRTVNIEWNQEKVTSTNEDSALEQINQSRFMVNMPDSIRDAQWDLVIVDGGVDGLQSAQLPLIFTASKVVRAGGYVIVHALDATLEWGACNAFLGRENQKAASGRMLVFVHQSADRQGSLPESRPVGRVA